MRYFTCFYYFFWSLFWCVERVVGYRIVSMEHKKAKDIKNLGIWLVVSDAIQVIMEVCLFSYFIACMCKVSVFLKSVQKH